MSESHFIFSSFTTTRYVKEKLFLDPAQTSCDARFMTFVKLGGLHNLDLYLPF